MTDASGFLSIQDLKVYRGSRLVVDVPGLDLQRGESLAIAGPNGAGKSTLLLAIAGLIRANSGSIRINNVQAQSNPAAIRRQCALVLQEPLLLHTSARENIATGLNFRHCSKQEKAERVAHWMDVFGISHLAGRHASQLSGGEAQRISLARAFATGADLLLLDEPFSSLDAPTRASLLNDFQAILKSSRQTAIFITHDLDEALMLGSRIAILIGGRLRQVGEPRYVFNFPSDPEVADFVGVENILPGRVITSRDGMARVQAGRHILEIVGDQEAGRMVYACIRPEDITLYTGEVGLPASARNQVTSRISALVPKGALVRVHLENNDLNLVALITRNSALEMGLQPGMDVKAVFKASSAHLLTV